MRASSRWRVAQLALNCRQSPQAAMNQRSRPVVAYGLPLDQLENLLSEGQALAEDRQRALTTLTRKYCTRTPTPYCTCISRTSVAVRFSSVPHVLESPGTRNCTANTGSWQRSLLTPCSISFRITLSALAHCSKFHKPSSPTRVTGWVLTISAGV